MKKDKKSAVLKMLPTRWSDEAKKEVPLAEYPRPQMRRENWVCLNGRWKYAIRNDECRPEVWDGEIVVPYSPETLLSGVQRQVSPEQVLWYERTVNMDMPEDGKRVLLHFGAVDQVCTVWLNDVELGRHAGGYTPFSFDITRAICAGENVLRLKVIDRTNKGPEVFGKQMVERGSIWYTGQSGIWQTVWMEEVPAVSVESIRITPLFDKSQVEVQVDLSGGSVPCTVKVLANGEKVAEGPLKKGVAVLDLQGFRAWSPEDPFLYDLEIIAGEDRVKSYFGMRSFDIVRGAHGRKVPALNGRPVFHHGLLDQGYWSDGMYTPPCDEAMVWEISRLKEMGFNMLRKHIKVEPLRWYYHCDRLGMLVWQDFVSGFEKFNVMASMVLPFTGIKLSDKNYKRFGRTDAAGREAFLRDAKRTMELLHNCVGLCCWGPFNEGWGQFDSVEVTEMVRRTDPSRYIDHASGWHDQGVGDFQSSHIYFRPVKMKKDSLDRIMALTEFGGYSLAAPGHMSGEKAFGYKMFASREELDQAVAALYEEQILPAIEQGLGVSIYTQVSDVEDEINGLFTYDRELEKISVENAQRIARKINDTFDKAVNG